MLSQCQGAFVEAAERSQRGVVVVVVIVFAVPAIVAIQTGAAYLELLYQGLGREDMVAEEQTEEDGSTKANTSRGRPQLWLVGAASPRLAELDVEGLDDKVDLGAGLADQLNRKTLALRTVLVLEVSPLVCLELLSSPAGIARGFVCETDLLVTVFFREAVEGQSDSPLSLGSVGGILPVVRVERRVGQRLEARQSVHDRDGCRRRHWGCVGSGVVIVDMAVEGFGLSASLHCHIRRPLAGLVMCLGRQMLTVEVFVVSHVITCRVSRFAFCVLRFASNKPQADRLSQGRGHIHKRREVYSLVQVKEVRCRQSRSK